jgi:hypothetical protein
MSMNVDTMSEYQLEEVIEERAEAPASVVEEDVSGHVLLEAAMVVTGGCLLGMAVVSATVGAGYAAGYAAGYVSQTTTAKGT